jgi:UDP-N-acetylmuramate dehydrogenase
MMAQMCPPSSRLIDRLPSVRGRYSEDAPLARITWFRVGGPAEVMYRPADLADLQAFIKARPAGIPVTVLGVGSNTLVRDGGVPGVVLRLGRAFVGIRAEDGDLISGAGALDFNLATAARIAGIGGLEFLSGVPGTLGGALRMNAGAYGKEIKDVLVWAEALDPAGEVHRLAPEDLGLTYRHCALPQDWIFLGARLAGAPDTPEAIARRMAEIQKARSESQPIRSRTGGSTFKNPPDAKAWQLIDRAGCRGLTIGGAKVSEQHCNFLINTGEATADDLEKLGEEVRRRVRASAGLELDWEIRRIGVPGHVSRAGEAS